MEEQKLYKLKNSGLVELTQQGRDNIEIAKGGEIIIFHGSQRSGQTTAINYLLGKLKKYSIEKTEQIEGIEDDTVLGDVIESDGFFKIQHQDDQHTSPFQILKVQDHFWFDYPVFSCYCGKGSTEFEISNHTTLSTLLKNCNSVRLVYFLDTKDLRDKKGEWLKEILMNVIKMVKNPIKENLEKITFLYTRAELSKNSIISLMKEQLKLINSTEKEFIDQVMEELLRVILNQLERIDPIIDLRDGKQESILKAIVDSSPFTNPTDDLQFNISQSSLELIENYNYNSQSKGYWFLSSERFVRALHFLSKFKQFSQETQIEEFIHCYQQLKSFILDEAFKITKFNTFAEFSSAAAISGLFSLEILQKIRKYYDDLNSVQVINKSSSVNQSIGL